MELTELALLLLPALSAPRQHDAAVIAQAMVDAVAADPDEPLTGSREGDVSLGLRFAMDESSLRITDSQGECVNGDSRHAWGTWQLQHANRGAACDPVQAARIWLERAHASVRRCWALDADARLAALASGNCSHGRAVSRERMRGAREALARVEEESKP